MPEESKPKSFPAAKHDKGELKYVDKVPVLILKGKPAEMGEQFGKLAIANAPDLTALAPAVPQGRRAGEDVPVRCGNGEEVEAELPRARREGMEAAAKASGREESLLLFANTIADLSSGMGCSTIIVEKDRSTTGQPLFGLQLRPAANQRHYGAHAGCRLQG